MTGAKINDIWSELAAGLVLDQYAESTNLKALIKVFVDAGQTFENATDVLKKFYNLSGATGVKLDLLGKIRNLPRKDGESDSSYKARILADVQIHNAGTPNFILLKASEESGDPEPSYIEEQKAPVVLIYTPEGKQLTSEFLEKLTPVGVCGAPASVFVNNDVERKTFVSASGKKFVGVSRRITDRDKILQIKTAGGLYITSNGLKITTRNDKG